MATGPVLLGVATLATTTSRPNTEATEPTALSVASRGWSLSHRRCVSRSLEGAGYPPMRDSSRSRSRSIQRIASVPISPASREERRASRSAAISSRRHLRQIAELSATHRSCPQP